MKTGKRRIIVAVLAVLLFAIGLSVFLSIRTLYSDRNIYQRNWHVALPENLNERFSADTPTQLQGEGIRYTIYDVPQSSLNQIQALTAQNDPIPDDAVEPD